MSKPAFDDLADVYDALIDWPQRLANEEPFYRALFERVGVRRVLDTACGTGRQVALFHTWGCHAEGADVSPGMITRCQQKHGESDSLRWHVRSFEAPISADAPFDAVICVGNSLALAADHDSVSRAIQQMLAALRPGGVCVAQVLNLWRLPDGPCTWQKHKLVQFGGASHLLIKGVHRAGRNGHVDLIDVLMTPDGPSPRFDAVQFLGLEAGALAEMAHAAAASAVQTYGNFQMVPYDRVQSPDLLVVIER